MCYDIKILILFVTDLPSYKLVIFYSYVKVYQRVAMENDPCVDDLGPIRMATFHRPTTQWNRGLPGEIPFQHETPSWKLVFSIFLVDW